MKLLLKQRLKHILVVPVLFADLGLNETSTKTKIETLCLLRLDPSYMRLNETSTKTKIETQVPFPNPSIRRGLNETSTKTKIETPIVPCSCMQEIQSE